ncbi:hypothetical protein ACOSQ2_000889 [Xanthoceras sorbifolium]
MVKLKPCIEGLMSRHYLERCCRDCRIATSPSLNLVFIQRGETVISLVASLRLCLVVYIFLGPPIENVLCSLWKPIVKLEYYIKSLWSISFFSFFSPEVS